MLFDFIGVNSSGYYFGHQFRQLIPSLSIILGIILAAYLSRLLFHFKYKNWYLTLILSTLFIVMLPYKSILLGLEHVMGNKQNDPDKELGIWLKENTKTNDYIYLIDISSMPALAYSERISSSKYFNSIFITSEFERNIVLNELILKPPVIILKQISKTDIPVNLGSNIENLILMYYSYQGKKYDYDIFKRK
jgi:hypothetical protein